MDIETASGKEVFVAVAAQQTKNLLVEVLGTLFVWWLAGAWSLGAIMAFVVFVLVTLWEGIHLVTMRRATTSLMRQADVEELERQADTRRWLFRAEVLRWLYLAVAVALLVVLYLRIW